MFSLFWLIISHCRTFLQKLTNYQFFAFLVGFYLLTRLNTWFYPIDNDHWIFWTVAQDWVTGGKLYLTTWDHKPPMIFLFNALLYLLGGDNLWIHRLVITVISFLGVVLFYQLLRFLFSDNSQLETNLKVRLSVIIYVFWINLSHISAGGNNNENLGIIFLLISYLAYFYFWKSEKWFYLLISGLSVSVLFFLKPNFILFFVPVLIDLLFFKVKQMSFIKLTKILFLLGLPILIHICFWLIYFYLNDSLYDFFIASFLFNSKYLATGWLGKVSGQLIFIFIIFPIILSLLVAAFYLFRKQTLFSQTELSNPPFIVSWLIISVIYVVMLGTFYPYYYLMIVPILAVLTGFSLSKMVQPTCFDKMILNLIIVSFIGSFIFSWKQPYNFFFGQVNNDFQEKLLVAEYIKANTTEEDAIIAYVYGSTFYYLTERKPGVRYVSASHPLLDYREKFGFQFNQKFIEDAEKNQPKYLIVANFDKLYSTNYELMDYFNQHYFLEKTFTNYSVFKRSSL